MYRTGAGTQADPRELCEPGRDYHGAAEEGRAGRGEVQEFPGALKGPYVCRPAVFIINSTGDIVYSHLRITAQKNRRHSIQKSHS